MNEEQHLTYELGMTNVPSDATCDDNGLEESIGLTYADGEHRVIQKPVEYIKGMTNKTLIYTHKLSDVERYIIREGNSVKWGTKVNGQYTPAQSGGSDVVLFTASGDINISSIGKTLIITDDNAMHYFKWDGSKYKSIAFPIPGLGFSAKLGIVSGAAVANSGKAEGILGFKPDGIRIIKKEEYNDLVVGLYSKNLKEIAQQKGFAEPFMVRAAYEMYDGSYINITNPILLFPSVTENTRFYIYGLDGEAKGLIAFTQVCNLYVRRSGDLSEYSDIIKDIVVFASKGVNIYKTNEDQPITNEDEVYTVGDSISSEDPDLYPDDPSIYRTTTYPAPSVDGFILSSKTLRCLLKRNNKDITNDIEETSIFYKIASLGLKPINSYVNIASKIREDALVNLENQERLEYDDYFSRNSLVPKITYAYNSRLNLANVKRGFFNGFDFFMPLDDNDYHSYTFDVTIVTDAGEKKVRVVEPRTRQKQGIYFYYPDPRANHVTIYKAEGAGYKIILDANLKEHPFLNGAYYYAGVTPTTDEPTVRSIPASEFPDPPVTEYETLYNQIIQSEVNNPWLFLAKGYNSVGFSEIKGVSTITQALSQGQFGAYPLLVFSEEGIWAMSVDGTGLYNAIHPMSREVCSNAKGITQTDGAVFFPSKKGLMVVVGSDVRCVSEQLSGKSDEPFAEFLQDAVIAYDYRDGLLWIFNDESDYAWIYNIKSGTFGRYEVDVEQQQVQQQAAPLLQSSPRRSASNSYIGVRLFTELASPISMTVEHDISLLDNASTKELIYVIGTTSEPSIEKFFLRGHRLGDAADVKVYFDQNWMFDGHGIDDYNDPNTGHPRTDTAFYRYSNGHYYAYVNHGSYYTFDDLGTEDPTQGDYITPSVNSLSFAQAGETKTFGISSNVSWAISKSSGSDWLTTISPDHGSNNDTIYVTAEPNANANSRTATLTISDGTISATVSISQAGTSPTPPTPTPADKITVVNNYPDYLIQLDDVVYSLIERPDINDDNSGPYAASMITRALKLGGGLTLKSIMRMKNIFDIHSGGTLSVEIWAKNNLNDAWVQLTHLRGVPHKYYQLRYTFTGLLATDRFAGTVLITQERRTNKLR